MKSNTKRIFLALLLPGSLAAVEQFTYRVTDRKPQDTSLYVQGPLVNLPLNRIITIDEHTPRNLLLKSEYYQIFLKQHQEKWLLYVLQLLQLILPLLGDWTP